MKKLLFIVISLAFGGNTQVLYKRHSILDCFMDLQNSLDHFDVQSVVDLVQDIVITGSRLAKEFQHCYDLLKDDPPTPIQQILYDACEAKWKVAVGFEVGRLSLDIQKKTQIIIDLANKFSRCSGIVIPQLDIKEIN